MIVVSKLTDKRQYIRPDVKVMLIKMMLLSSAIFKVSYPSNAYRGFLLPVLTAVDQLIFCASLLMIVVSKPADKRQRIRPEDVKAMLRDIGPAANGNKFKIFLPGP